jgi:outer membrane receptor protein involved in Fe transport
MKQLVFAFVATLALQAAAAAASGVTVHVTDPHQKPIAGAAVTLTSRNAERWTATTNTAGACTLAAPTAGEYFLEAAAPGFDPAPPRTINLQAGAELSITLGVAAVRSSVVVTASGTPQSADELSKSLTVVDSETTTLRADKSVGDALVDVPGIRVQQLGGPLSTMYFKIRGLRNTDTAVLVDGLRLRDAAGTQADASGVLQDLVLTDTAQIEVLRGAGSSLYGTDATGGVVNIVTDEGGARTRGSIAVDGGSLGSVRGTAHLAGGLLRDRVQYSLGLTHWNVTSGVDGDSPARNTSGQGQVTIRLSPIAWISGRVYAGDSFGFIRISPRSVGTLPSTAVVDAVPLSLSQEHLYESGTPLSGLALGSATFLPAAFDPDSTRAGSFFTGALRFTVQPASSLGFTAQYQDLHTTRDYGNGPAGPGSQPAGNNLSQYIGRIQTASARMDAAVGRNHFNAGYEFEDEDFRNGLQPPPPTPAFYSDIGQRSNAIFAQDQLRLADGRLQFAAGYRAQFFSLSQPVVQPAAGSPFAGKTFASPPMAQTGDLSLAYTFRRSGTKIRSHAGRGYRAPSLYERFGTYFSGTSYTLYGDPGLRADRSSSIDGGIDQMLWNSRVQLSATYFYTRLNQVIIFDSSGVINQFTDPLGRNGGYRNTGGGLARGVEFRSDVAATRSLQLSASYTYVDARQATPLVPGVWQTYEIPRHQYSAFATQRFGSRLIAYFGYAGSSSYLDPVSSRAFRLPGPSRAQTAVSYRRPLREFSAVRFYLKADNLFNQTYFENGYRTPGVGVTAGTQWEF